jgi:hypothetical protein
MISGTANEAAHSLSRRQSAAVLAALFLRSR